MTCGHSIFDMLPLELSRSVMTLYKYSARRWSGKIAFKSDQAATYVPPLGPVVLFYSCLSQTQASGHVHAAQWQPRQQRSDPQEPVQAE